MAMIWWFLLLLPMAFGLAYRAAGLAVWVAAGLLWLGGFALAMEWSMTTALVLGALYLIVAGVFLLRPLRRWLISTHLLHMFRKVLPAMSPIGPSGSFEITSGSTT
jgi:hypothetical protein